MALEKFEYPTTSPTIRWTATGGPIESPDFEEDDMGIVSDVSAGGKVYNYGRALFTVYHNRFYPLESLAQKNDFFEFVRHVGGDAFRFVDYRAVHRKVTLRDFVVAYEALAEVWQIRCRLREESKVSVPLPELSEALMTDLLFYAPLKRNTDAIQFDFVEMTATFTPTGVAGLPDFDFAATTLLPQGLLYGRNGTGGRTQDDSLSYPSGTNYTMADPKGSLVMIMENCFTGDVAGNEHVIALTWDYSGGAGAGTEKEYHDGALIETRTGRTKPEDLSNGKLMAFSANGSHVRHVMTFKRVLTDAEVDQVGDLLIAEN